MLTARATLLTHYARTVERLREWLRWPSRDRRQETGDKEERKGEGAKQSLVCRRLKLRHEGCYPRVQRKDDAPGSSGADSN